MRIGESDGVERRDSFHSELVVRSARQLRLLEALLPDFENRDRLLIVRTWSVGVYPVGDLIWNRDTFGRASDGLESDALVLSMKYGESDFFRHLPLNRHFFRSSHKKLVELQARREYEGFGEVPAFTGWDVERYREELRDAENVVGFSVWCQTGGWTRFDRLTYLEDSSFWTELNVETTVDVWDGAGVPEAVRRFCRRRQREGSAEALLLLLAESDRVLDELLYVDEVATQKLFFRRLRLVLRRQRGYRRRDRVVSLWLLRRLYPIVKPLARRVVPEFAERTAMGIDSLLR